MEAKARIHVLSIQQATLRVRLKQIDPRCLEAHEIRRAMRLNRSGQDGLKALNTRLRGTSLRKRKRNIIV